MARAARTRRDDERDIGPSHEIGARTLPVVFAALVLASAIAFYYLATHRTWRLTYERPEAGYASRYFLAQARSMASGHLAVSPSDLPGECYVRAGACFGYFGITPSLLRLPVLPLVDSRTTSLTPVFITAALSLAFASMLVIMLHITGGRVPRRALPLVLAVAGAIGPAGLLIHLTRPAVYEEAIAWSVAFACLSLFSFLKWWDRLEAKWLALLVISLTLSTNARPTAIPMVIVLALGVAGRAWRSGADRGEDRAIRRRVDLRQAGGILLVFLCPILTAIGVYVIKVHRAIPDMRLNEQLEFAPWWVDILRINGDHTIGAIFILTSALAYVRPDALIFTRSFPFVDFRFPTTQSITYLGGLPSGGAYVEPVSSVPIDAPLCVVLIAVATFLAVSALRRTGPLRLTNPFHSPMAVGIIAASSALIVTLTNVAITDRYLGDFYPVVALGSLWALRRCMGPFTRLQRSARLFLEVLLVVGVAWGGLVNWALAHRIGW